MRTYVTSGRIRGVWRVHMQSCSCCRTGSMAVVQLGCPICWRRSFAELRPWLLEDSAVVFIIGCQWPILLGDGCGSHIHLYARTGAFMTSSVCVSSRSRFAKAAGLDKSVSHFETRWRCYPSKQFPILKSRVLDKTICYLGVGCMCYLSRQFPILKSGLLDKTASHHEVRWSQFLKPHHCIQSPKLFFNSSLWLSNVPLFEQPTTETIQRPRCKKEVVCWGGCKTIQRMEFQSVCVYCIPANNYRIDSNPEHRQMTFFVTFDTWSQLLVSEWHETFFTG